MQPERAASGTRQRRRVPSTCARRSSTQSMAQAQPTSRRLANRPARAFGPLSSLSFTSFLRPSYTLVGYTARTQMMMNENAAPQAGGETERLKISAFGKISISFKGASAKPVGRKAQALLGFLLLSGAPTASRERLFGLLWSETDEQLARGSLRQSLRELQAALRSIKFPHLDAQKHSVGFERARLDVDLWNVLRASERGIVHPLLLSQGNITDTLLEGLDNVDPAFTTWLRDMRAVLREQLVANLAQCLPQNETGPVTEASEVAARAIALLEPGHEASARAIIRARWAAGDIGAALGNYQRLWHLLEKEFDVEPAPETHNLIARLRLEQPTTAAPALATEPFALISGRLTRVEGLRPSIAILPFQTVGAKDEQYFGEGIVDDIVQALAGLKELLVISKGTTRHYRHAAPDVRMIGRDLGVQYVLHGNVQKSGDRLRIHTMLAETETAEIVKTGRYDGNLAELFDLQDQIALETTKLIAPTVRERELRRAMRKHPNNLTAYDFVLQAVGPLHDLEYSSFSRTRGLLGKAIEIDPTFAPAYAYLAHWHCYRIGQMWSTNINADMSEAERLSVQAIALDHTNSTALAVNAHVKCIRYRDYEGSRVGFELALAESPNSAFAWTMSAVTESCAGRGREGIAHALNALRLSPRDNFSHYPHFVLAQSQFVAGEFSNAVLNGRIAAERNNRFAANLRILAASLVEIGDLDGAKEVVTQHLRLVPNFSLNAWSERTWLSPTVCDRVAENLRRAGMPA